MTRAARITAFATFAAALAAALSAPAFAQDALTEDEQPIVEDTDVSDVAEVAQPEVARAEALKTTVSGGYEFESFDALGGSDRWKTAQTGTIALTARGGNAFSLAARLEAPYTNDPLRADDVIDELAVSWAPAPIMSLTAGKQILKWGTARALSSIDRLAPPLDPLDPAKTRRGVTGFRADVIPTWWLSVSTVAVPPLLDGGYFDTTTLALRTELLVGETDLSLGAIRSVNENGDEEPAVFADFARFFERFGVYGEAQAVFADETEVSATGGVQFDIPAWLNGSITCLGEYRYLSETDGATHQLYAGVSGIPVTRRLNAGASVLAAPERKTGRMARQAVLGTSLDWKISQTVNAKAEWKYLLDDKTDGTPLVPIYTANRQSVTASVSASY